jgi:hypothetical protein
MSMHAKDLAQVFVRQVKDIVHLKDSIQKMCNLLLTQQHQIDLVVKELQKLQFDVATKISFAQAPELPLLDIDLDQFLTDESDSHTKAPPQQGYDGAHCEPSDNLFECMAAFQIPRGSDGGAEQYRKGDERR